MNRGFGPKYRLRDRREFLAFFGHQQQQKLGGKNFVVYRVPNHQEHFRLGITIKSRTSSVCRNRVKRAVRECFREMSDGLGYYDYNVVIPSGKNLDRDYASALRHELSQRVRGWPS